MTKKREILLDPCRMPESSETVHALVSGPVRCGMSVHIPDTISSKRKIVHDCKDEYMSHVENNYSPEEREEIINILGLSAIKITFSGCPGRPETQGER